MERKADPALHAYLQGLVENRHSIWDHFYASGGWGMYPTTVFGFLLVSVACIYCFRLDKRLIPVVVTTGVLTVASGILGTFMGLMVVFSYIQTVEPTTAAKVAAVGAAPAFANIVFALVLAILGGVATLAGVVRQALRKAL